MAEVYAGFLSHADAQLGRVLDHLEAIDQLDNTLDRPGLRQRRQRRGRPNGSVNENKITNGVPDDLAENLSMLDELGGTKTYNHYPNGWAMAFNTPFKMWKRYSFNGGTCDPCIISWPAGISARGEIRDQYHHAIDIVPTVLDCLGVEQPDEVKGATQIPFQGVSMRYSFDAANIPTAQTTQFYSMLGTRGDLARRLESRHHPPRHQRLEPLRAGHLGALPHGRGPLRAARPRRGAARPAQRTHRPVVLRGRRQPRVPARRPVSRRDPDTPRPQLVAPRNRYVYRPGGARCPSRSPSTSATGPTRSAPWSTCPGPGAQGVLFAHGSRFGGHALYVKDNRLHYVYNFLGIIEQRVIATEDLPTGARLLLAASFEKDGEDPPGVAVGNLTLWHGDRKVGEARIRTQPGKFAIAGEGLCVGRDSGEPVTDDYPGDAPVDLHRRHPAPGRRRRQRRAVCGPGARSRGHAGRASDGRDRCRPRPPAAGPTAAAGRAVRAAGLPRPGQAHRARSATSTAPTASSSPRRSSTPAAPSGWPRTLREPTSASSWSHTAGPR